MNCTELDGAVEDVRALLFESDGGFALSVGALLLASGVLLAFGERLVRPVGAAVAGAAAGGAIFVVSAAFEQAACWLRLTLAGAAAVLASVLVLCLFKAGLFALGAAAFGGLTHFVYEALPLDGIEPPFILLGRSGYYYIAVGVAGIAGAIVSHWQRESFVRITTSLLGGGGVALSVYVIADHLGERVPGVVLLVTLLVVTLGGVYVQHQLHKRRTERRLRGGAAVPLGIPVARAGGV